MAQPAPWSESCRHQITKNRGWLSPSTSPAGLFWYARPDSNGRPTDSKFLNQDIEGQSGIYKDIIISGAYNKVIEEGHRVKHREIGGYFLQSVDQVLTKNEKILIRNSERILALVI